MNKSSSVLIVLSFLMIVTACNKPPNEPEMQQNDNQKEEAVETSSKRLENIEVALKDKNETEIGGAVLTEVKDGVQVNVKVNDLQPGNYAIHIHEAGICEPPSFELAGGHFNPDDKKHGFYQKDGPHKGDMENLKVDEDGTADQMYLNELVTLEEGDPNSLLTDEGTSIIIHEKEDDYMSQPAGDAGARIFCGVISSPKK